MLFGLLLDLVVQNLQKRKIPRMTPVKKVTEVMHLSLPYISACMTVLLTVIGYFILQELNSIGTLEVQVAELHIDAEVMKGNRFTSADGLEVWKEIQSIRVELTRMSSKIPEKIPPDWFEKKVDALSLDVDDNGKQINQVLQQVNENKQTLKRVDDSLIELKAQAGRGM